ncbi:MAG: 5'-nucleotidase, lipoprotein e(P4) family [Bacteroidia bacterium]
MYRYLPLVLLLLFSCKLAQKSPAVQDQSTAPAVAPLEHKALAVLFVQRSAEYRALVYQTYFLAEMRLREIRARKPEQKLAVVVDIDETLLDNSPYGAWQVLNNQPYTFESWKRWTDLAAADTVPGALRFLQVADSLEYAVFYISNRKQEELQATMKNLQRFDFPAVNEERVLLRTTTSGKEPRREKVRRQGYEIAMMAGDNLNDFLEDFEKKTREERNAKVDSVRNAFGNRLIVLPNPVYGEWENAMYRYQFDLSPAMQDSVRRSLLKGF